MGSYAHAESPVPVHSHFFLERLSGEVRPFATDGFIVPVPQQLPFTSL
jgi:hypothetical protein